MLHLLHSDITFVAVFEKSSEIAKVEKKSNPT